MNTLSILASYGALVIIFQMVRSTRSWGFTPLGFVEASAPILLFCALFGLSMDYEGPFCSHAIQEAFWQTGNNRKAWRWAWSAAGGIITSAAVIVIVVSACFATADMILGQGPGPGDGSGGGAGLPLWCVACWCQPPCACWATGIGGCPRRASSAVRPRWPNSPRTVEMGRLIWPHFPPPRLIHRWEGNPLMKLPISFPACRRISRLRWPGRLSQCALLLLLALALVACNVPGVPATTAHLPQVGRPTTPTTLPRCASPG